MRPVKPALQRQRRNNDDCAHGRQLKDGKAPRIEITGATLAHRCSHRPAEDCHRQQCEAQNVMRCRDGHKTRRQQPKTQHAAGHRADIDERLRLAAARPFHRDEPQRHRMEDQRAGPDVDILQAGQTRSNGYSHEQQDHRNMPPAPTAIGRRAEAQAGGTDKDGRAEQTDAGEQQWRRRSQRISDRTPAGAHNNGDEGKAAKAGHRPMFHRTVLAVAARSVRGWLSAAWNASLFSSGLWREVTRGSDCACD